MKFVDLHTDPWHSAGGEDGPQPHPPVSPHSLLSLEQWHAVREHWPAAVPVGVVLPNTAEVDALAADLPRLALVVLQFPKWIDGRAYSQARVIRARHRYAGELRATGDVVVDMLPLLKRTGFDAVRLRFDQKLASAQRALEFFPGHYQGDVTQPQPAFARDLAAELAQAAAEHAPDIYAGEGI